MGSPAGEVDSEESSEQVQLARAFERKQGFEETAHEVELTRACYLGAHLEAVTWGEAQEFLKKLNARPQSRAPR
jgi:hypothetical protein